MTLDLHSSRGLGSIWNDAQDYLVTVLSCSPIAGTPAIEEAGPMPCRLVEVPETRMGENQGGWSRLASAFWRRQPSSGRGGDVNDRLK